MGVIRILLGAINEESGGRALILTRGIEGVPAVELTDPAGKKTALLPVRSDIPGWNGQVSPLAAELAKAEVAVYHLAVPPFRGSVQVKAWVGADSVEARFRPFPVAPRGSVSFSLSSCYYGYFHLGSLGRYLWTAAESAQFQGHQIDFKLLVGDNLYLDVAPDQDSFGDDDSARETTRRYIDYFLDDDDVAIAGASSPTLLTFDDHDLWNDYPHSSAWLSRTWGDSQPVWARAAWDGIDNFQMPLNPPALNVGGRSYKFTAGGVRFFMADTRTARSLASANPPKLMAPSDLDSLETWLREPGGPRVLIVGQPLWQQAENKTLFVVGDHNLAAYPGDFARICQALHDCPADVLILTGDPHFSRVLSLSTIDSRKVYEVVSSPAAHIPSVGATIGHNLFNTALKGPSSDRVSIDGNVAFEGNQNARLKVSQYLYGTSANTVFSLLTLTPRSDGTTDVKVTFVNHQKNAAETYPPAEPIHGYPSPVVQNATVNFKLGLRGVNS